MSPEPVAQFLSAPALLVAARVLITFPFWVSGVMKLADFRGGVAEMEMFGFHPGWAYNLVCVAIQFVCSALIIANTATWLGAGILAVFTLFTIFRVQRFWRMEGPMRIATMNTALEHVGIVGGLILVAILSGG